MGTYVFRSVEDVLELAIQREAQAHEFYMQLAQQESEHKLRFEIEYELLTFGVKKL